MDPVSFRLRRAVLLGTVLLFAYGCARDSSEPQATGGRALYEANCLACHGEGALGDGELAGTLPVQPPSLLDHLAHHTQAQLVQLIRDGVPPAMPRTALSDEEIQTVVDYVWTLVPEDQVESLRAMQEHMEMMGDSAMGQMPGMMGDSAGGPMPGL